MSRQSKGKYIGRDFWCGLLLSFTRAKASGVVGYLQYLNFPSRVEILCSRLKETSEDFESKPNCGQKVFVTTLLPFMQFEETQISTNDIQRWQKVVLDFQILQSPTDCQGFQNRNFDLNYRPTSLLSDLGSAIT